NPLETHLDPSARVARSDCKQAGWLPSPACIADRTTRCLRRPTRFTRMPQQLSGGRGMKFGSFMEFPPVSTGRESAAFDQALAEVEAGGEYGLDAVWRVELHAAAE